MCTTKWQHRTHIFSITKINQFCMFVRGADILYHGETTSTFVLNYLFPQRAITYRTLSKWAWFICMGFWVRYFLVEYDRKHREYINIYTTFCEMKRVQFVGYLCSWTRNNVTMKNIFYNTWDKFTNINQVMRVIWISWYIITKWNKINWVSGRTRKDMPNIDFIFLKIKNHEY